MVGRSHARTTQAWGEEAAPRMGSGASEDTVRLVSEVMRGISGFVEVRDWRREGRGPGGTVLRQGYLEGLPWGSVHIGVWHRTYGCRRWWDSRKHPLSPGFQCDDQAARKTGKGSRYGDFRLCPVARGSITGTPLLKMSHVHPP